VDDTGNITQAGQDDVDEEISAAAALEEYTERREEDGENDLDDVAESGVSRMLSLQCARAAVRFERHIALAQVGAASLCLARFPRKSVCPARIPSEVAKDDDELTFR
jgi:hypothetical protein